MIDILCVAYSNYKLFYENILYHLKLSDEFRFLVCDATSIEHGRKELEIDPGPRVQVIPYQPFSDYDGISHGAALDLLVSKAQSDIICTIDHDFFWIRPDVVDWAHHLFSNGYQAVGAAGYYPPTIPDWIESIDKQHPDRAGWRAPVCWGQFMSRDLAASETFVTQPDEGSHGHETGWRLRKKLIDEELKRMTLPGFQIPKQEDELACYFGAEKFPVGLHFFRGITRHSDADFDKLAALIKRGREPWLSSKMTS